MALSQIKVNNSKILNIDDDLIYNSNDCIQAKFVE